MNTTTYCDIKIADNTTVYNLPWNILTILVVSWWRNVGMNCTSWFQQGHAFRQVIKRQILSNLFKRCTVELIEMMTTCVHVNGYMSGDLGEVWPWSTEQRLFTFMTNISPRRRQTECVPWEGWLFLTQRDPWSAYQSQGPAITYQAPACFLYN